MRKVVVDTNVAVVANRKAEHVQDERCIESCIDALLCIVNAGRVAIDDSGQIIKEYFRHLSLSGQPGTGDAFFQWVWNNQANTKYVERVHITPIGNNQNNYQEFPQTAELRRFHSKDRKFVAVALTSASRPKILNACDTGWWKYRQELRNHGCIVKFLCPNLMASV
jgi:hypothetical protein